MRPYHLVTSPKLTSFCHSNGSYEPTRVMTALHTNSFLLFSLYKIQNNLLKHLVLNSWICLSVSQPYNRIGIGRDLCSLYFVTKLIFSAQPCHHCYNPEMHVHHAAALLGNHYAQVLETVYLFM